MSIPAAKADPFNASSSVPAAIGVGIQTADFDVGEVVAEMRARNPRIGAVATFIGLVRDTNQGDSVGSMTLEHYPGMTEKAIEQICVEAGERFDVESIRVVHRVGALHPTDQIVLVAAASAHRAESFAACEFIMDYLKTQAPFWKKESVLGGGRWVEERASDVEAANRWKHEDRN